MSVGVNFSGLGSGTTMSHIHCCLSFPFQPNNNVMVATTTPTFPGFPLGVTAGNYAMTFNLLNPATYNPAFITSAFNPSGTVAGADAALVSGIAAGETYLNVHTTNFPGGEIRGFLTPVSGEAVTGAQQGAFQIMTEFLTLMMDPFVYGRTGFGGADGFAPAAVYKEPVARRALAPFEQRWTVWGGGYGATSRSCALPTGGHCSPSSTANLPHTRRLTAARGLSVTAGELVTSQGRPALVRQRSEKGSVIRRCWLNVRFARKRTWLGHL